MIGTVIYAPISAHLPGFFYDKRDDLEALCYVLKHLRTNNLPWKNYNTTSDEGLEDILRSKRDTSPYELFNDMPIEFAYMLEYIKMSPSDEHINYRYLEKLLYQVAFKNNFTIDWRYDWMPKPEKIKAIKPPPVEENIEVAVN